jgi:hypothetical protein
MGIIGNLRVSDFSFEESIFGGNFPATDYGHEPLPAASRPFQATKY